MSKLRSSSTKKSENHYFSSRLTVAFIFILLMFTVLVSRFFYLQVIKHEDYTTRAKNNQISLIPTPASRGTIVDRNGVTLARNYAAYTLEITPNKVKDLEKTIADLGELVNLTEGDIRRFKKNRVEARSYDNIPLKLKLTDEEVAKVAANLYRLDGVEVASRSFREYPYGELTAHFLGYIGRISQKDQDKLKEDDNVALYRGSTHMGKTGLEAYYEAQLRGQPGFSEVEKDAAGRIVRMLKQHDPIDGDTLKLSLDIKLQQEADRLFGQKRGALVAIDPKTGQVLAFVSKPSFDPNLFIDGIDTETWDALNNDKYKPLINRALRGLYPPGSTFKPFMGMAILETGTLSQTDLRPAPGFFSLPGSSHRFRDSNSRGHGVANLSKAIQVSSDTFFYRVGWDMGIDKITPTLAKFGLGSQTGIDLDHETKGILPSREWKAKRYADDPKRREWNRADVISISIGQGSNTYTPLQMAHATAILANDGVVFKPHLVQEIISGKNQAVTKVDATPVRTLPFSKSNMDYIKNAMTNVLKPGGTGWRIGQGLQYPMAGKTGTAQVVQIKQNTKYNAAALAEEHRDHSWFIAFAPANDPQIAIAVIVENGGFGASAAAPIARQLSDFYVLPRLRAKAAVQPPQQPSIASEESSNADPIAN